MLSEKESCIEKMQKMNAKNEHEIFDIEQYKKMMKYASKDSVKEFNEKLEEM